MIPYTKRFLLNHSIPYRHYTSTFVLLKQLYKDLKMRSKKTVTKKGSCCLIPLHILLCKFVNEHQKNKHAETFSSIESVKRAQKKVLDTTIVNSHSVYQRFFFLYPVLSNHQEALLHVFDLNRRKRKEKRKLFRCIFSSTNISIPCLHPHLLITLFFCMKYCKPQWIFFFLFPIFLQFRFFFA